jgi:hypothetical protein
LFVLDISGPLRILPFPLLLILLRKEPHSRRFSLKAPAVFHHPHVTIDLHLIQGLRLEFAVPGFKSDGVLLLRALDRCTEIGIEARAVILEKRELLIEARGIEVRILGPLEAFEATYGLVNASIHQQYCFVQMRLLHLNLLLRSAAEMPQSDSRWKG